MRKFSGHILLTINVFVALASVFPNPVTAGQVALIAIDRSEDQVSGQVVVTNAAGKQVMQQDFRLSGGDRYVKLDTRSFAPGTYIIKVQAGSEVYTHKLSVRD